MGKPIVNMTDWELYVYNEEYSLSGRADRHPRMGKDAYIYHTSKFVDYCYKEDELIYETLNTMYVCPLKYMTRHPYSSVVSEYKKKLTHRADNSELILDKIIAAAAKIAIENEERQMSDGEKRRRKTVVDFSGDEFLARIKGMQMEGQAEIEQMQREEANRLIGIALQYEDCVYLEVSNVGEGNVLAYHLGDDTGVVYPRVHSGMFQDSVLYMKYARQDDPCSLDFRYFPRGMGNEVETYSWSDNIARAVIKNDSASVLYFNRTPLEAGETKVFSPESHRQGLVSPDCHNGKSVLFTGKTEKE